MKAPVSTPRSNNAHAELSLLYHSVYQSVCSEFPHSWISPQATWTSPPAPLHFPSLAEYTFGVLRDTIPQSFQSWFSFLLGRTQQKIDQMRAEDPVEKIHACCTNSSAKSKGSSCNSQKWHPRRGVSDCLSDSYRPRLSKLFGRGPHRLLHNSSRANILRTVNFSGYVTFYIISRFFVNILSFHYWQNMFCGRLKWLRR